MNAARIPLKNRVRCTVNFLDNPEEVNAWMWGKQLYQFVRRTDAE